LRCPVLDRYTDRGTIALSKVEQGTLKLGMKVMIMPTKMVTKVEAIYINDARVPTAKTGENVSIKLACSGKYYSECVHSMQCSVQRVCNMLCIALM
jgi:peptide chain release factor subunit 3